MTGWFWMTTTILLLILVIWDNKLIQERRARKQAEAELSVLVERLYGNKEKYDRTKRTVRGSTPREQKIAIECADKGIPRSNKQYPQRFKSTRRRKVVTK